MFDNFQGMLALPEDPNKNAAARQGLLAFGASLLGGQGDFGGILGNGLMAGSQTYNGALAQQQQQALRQVQLDQTKLENQKLQAAADKPAQIASVFSKMQSPGISGPRRLPPGDASLEGYTPRSVADLPKLGQSPAPAPAGAPQAAPTDWSAFYRQRGNALAEAGFTAEAKEQYDMAEKLRPKLKEQRALTAGGKRVMVNVFEDGTIQQLDGFDPDAEKLNFQNTGGATVAFDPYTGKPINTVSNTQSPDSVASVAATMRGQNMSDTRARELNEITKQGQRSQIINDPTQGPIVVDKGTGQARQVTLDGKAVPGEAVAKREASAKNLIPLIAQADKLIGGATGSYLGAGADQGARLFGVATNGAQNIAQLRVLEGNIMMAQPRMEGPQSNMDVELYRQMAAQVGDPTVPTSTKRAALSTLKSLYAKYDQDAPAPADSGKPQIKSLKDLPKKPGIPAGWTVKEK